MTCCRRRVTTAAVAPPGGGWPPTDDPNACTYHSAHRPTVSVGSETVNAWFGSVYAAVERYAIFRLVPY